jgi:hypothetical protein
MTTLDLAEEPLKSGRNKHTKEQVALTLNVLTESGYRSLYSAKQQSRSSSITDTGKELSLYLRVDTVSGAHAAFHQKVSSALSLWVKRWWGVTQSTDLHLVPRLIIVDPYLHSYMRIHSVHEGNFILS